MADCIPSAKSAAINPSPPKLVLGGAFHRSNRKIMNTERVEPNALPAPGLLTPYYPQSAMMEIFMGWKSESKSGLLRLLPWGVDGEMVGNRSLAHLWYKP